MDFLGAKWVLVQNGYQVHVDQIDLIAREFVSEVGGTNWLPGEMVGTMKEGDAVFQCLHRPKSVNYISAIGD